jgi:GTP-binding protein Era
MTPTPISTPSRSGQLEPPASSGDGEAGSVRPAGEQGDAMGDDALNDQIDLLVSDELPPDHRSGFVAVVGKPNAGKSTLMNAYLGQKIAIVSPKPQTTRNRLLGILTLERARGDLADAQVVFIDTPGIHQPLHKLGEYMVETAVRAIPDADLAVWIVDASGPPSEEDRQIAAILESRDSVPVLLALNKSDLLPDEERVPRREVYAALGSFEGAVFISALQRDNLDALLEAVVERLPYGPRYYPEEQVTDQQLRFMVAELIREQVLQHLYQEVPHSVAVLVQDFKERREDLTYISANVFVERDSQKAIILGQGGTMIKRIGRDARREIEDLLDTRVYLELWVKVKKKWRKDEQELRRLGYTLPRGKT